MNRALGDVQSDDLSTAHPCCPGERSVQHLPEIRCNDLAVLRQFFTRAFQHHTAPFAITYPSSAAARARRAFCSTSSTVVPSALIVSITSKTSETSLGGQSDRWFVEEKKPGPSEEGACHRKHLLLASREASCGEIPPRSPRAKPAQAQAGNQPPEPGGWCGMGAE